MDEMEDTIEAGTGGIEGIEAAEETRKPIAVSSITQEQRLQLLGLLTLADHHNRALDDIRSAMLQITDEREADGRVTDYGHTADLMFDNAPAVSRLNRLLKNLDIAVEETPAKAAEGQGGSDE